jgi:hypothetical protein
MGLTEKRFGNNGDLYAGSGSLHGSPQTGASCPDDKNIVLVRNVLGH